MGDGWGWGLFGGFQGGSLAKIEPTFFLNLIRMEFTLPANVKTVSTKTAKLYQKHLNHLATLGFDTDEKIAAKAEEVVEAISNIVAFVDNEEEAKHKARVYYSAIFYALYDHPMLKEKRNPLRNGFHRYDPSKTDDGEPWQKIKY